MKMVAKIVVATIIITLIISMLPENTLVYTGLGSNISVLKEYIQFVYSFFNPFTLYICVSIIFVVNSAGFVFKVSNFILEKFHKSE